MRPRRVRAYRSGLFAEAVAALLLRLKGHRIIARRYKTPVGEIDLVALKGQRLAFVEVKCRKSFEDAAWPLPAKQRRRIVRAAQYWLSVHPGFAGHELASTWCSPYLSRGLVISRMHFPFDGSGHLARASRP